MVSSLPTDSVSIANEWLPEMFGKVDAKLGEDLKKTTEAKLDGNHAHPHKTAWH